MANNKKNRDKDKIGLVLGIIAFISSIIILPLIGAVIGIYGFVYTYVASKEGTSKNGKIIAGFIINSLSIVQYLVVIALPYIFG